MKLTAATSIYGTIERPKELFEIVPEAIERAVPSAGDLIVYPHEAPRSNRRVNGAAELRARLAAR